MVGGIQWCFSHTPCLSPPTVCWWKSWRNVGCGRSYQLNGKTAKLSGLLSSSQTPSQEISSQIELSSQADCHSALDHVTASWAADILGFGISLSSFRFEPCWADSLVEIEPWVCPRSSRGRVLAQWRILLSFEMVEKYFVEPSANLLCHLWQGWMCMSSWQTSEWLQSPNFQMFCF